MSSSLGHLAHLARSAAGLQPQQHRTCQGLASFLKAVQAIGHSPWSSDSPQTSSAAVLHDISAGQPLAHLQDAQLQGTLHCQHSSAHRCCLVDRLEPDHAVPACWQHLHQPPHSYSAQGGLSMHSPAHRLTHTIPMQQSASVRFFTSSATCWQNPHSSQDSLRQHDMHRPPPSPRPGFVRQPPAPSPNGASAFAGDHRRPPSYGSSQQPSPSGSQRPPFQRSPPQASNNGGASPLQAWGPTYKHARHNPKSEGPQTRKLKANQEITAKEVRLVGTDGQHQVLPLAEALKAARDAKLDLVEVAGGAVPPVCRLLNHSQVSFEAKVKDRKAEKKQLENRRLATIKEVHFGAHTAEHDMQVKLKKAREFLQKGHKVKCTLKHRPVRGQGQKDALKALPLLKDRMAEFAEVSAPPPTEKQTPNSLSFYLAPLLQQNAA